LETHAPGCVDGSGARRGEAPERAASRSTSPGWIVLPGGLSAFALVAVTRRRWLLQALPGFPVAARVDPLPGVAGVALARLTERLAHTVQLSCLVLVDHVLDSSLAAGVHDATCSSFPASVLGRLHGSIRKDHGCMLTITPTAAEAMKGIVASPQVPERAGLRIATRPESPAEGAFEVSVAPVPAEEDQEGCRSYVGTGSSSGSRRGDSGVSGSGSSSGGSSGSTGGASGTSAVRRGTVLGL
jgi:uncharacterized membrane protein YgcG